MQCKNCGAVNPNDPEYCEVCGLVLDQPHDSSQQSASAEPASQTNRTEQRTGSKWFSPIGRIGLNFFKAVESALDKYRKFQGRASRSEYWYFLLFYWILTPALFSYLHGPMPSNPNEDPNYIVLLLFFGFLTISFSAVTVRRLHDGNHPGWWIFPLVLSAFFGIYGIAAEFGYLPFLVLLPWLYFMCKPGEAGENKYGNRPSLETSLPHFEDFFTLGPGRPFTFVEAIKRWLSYKRIANFSGRSSRSECWWFFPAPLVLNFFGGYFGVALKPIADNVDTLFAFLYIGSFLPLFAVAVRRLHDVNRTGFWLWIAPTGAGLVPLFYWMCKPSDVGENKYGSPIKHPSKQVTDQSTSPPADPSQASTSWIRRHWQGDLSLAKSFWINYCLFIIVVNGSFRFFTLTEWDARLLQVQISTFYSVVCVAILFWQSIGCWRSANRYINHTGKVLWSQAAQGILAGGLLFILTGHAYSFSIGIGQATGLGSSEQYTLTLNETGEILRLDGLIAHRLPHELEEILDKSPNIGWIQLNSLGGWKHSALHSADIIAQHELTTFVVEECSSACTELFLSSKIRILSTPDGFLGFHMGGYAAGWQGWLPFNEKDIEIERQKLLSFGVSAEFADQVVSTPLDDMWYPTVEDLFDNNIITHIYDGVEDIRGVGRPFD